MFYLPGRKELSRPSDWLIRRLKKIRFSYFPVAEEDAIFRVQKLAVMLSHSVSTFEWGGGFMCDRFS